MRFAQLVTRRTVLRTAAVLAAAAVTGCSEDGFEESESTPLTNSPSTRLFMPDEAGPHARTWMALATSASIWGDDLLADVQTDQVLIALTIAKYEPVSMLVNAVDVDLATQLINAGGSTAHPVEIVRSSHDDLWTRDTCCTFVRQNDPNGALAAVDFNFNGWGEKQEFALDAKVARFVAGQVAVPLVTTSLVLEGGGFEVDGEGTAIIAESCMLIDNRNPGVSKEQFESLLKPLLGLEKIIWIPGVRGKDITDGHTDFYARFASPGVVLAGYDPDPDSYDHEVTLANIAILNEATDARGRKLQVTRLTGPTEIRSESPDVAAGYIGYYACNGAIIAQEFGDAAADAAAKAALQAAYPGRVIEQLNVDAIAEGGGSIHCATQQQPA